MGTPVAVPVVIGYANSVGPATSKLSITTPLLNPSSDEYFACCGADLGCRLMVKRDLDLNQATLLSRMSFFMQCISKANPNPSANATTRRMLLQDSQGEVQQCFTGQYNLERGNNDCFNCPLGNSTRL